MDVRMPDGTVISNVPDDISQDELLARYNSYASSTPKQSSFDPLTGVQVADIAPKVEAPKPTLLTGTTLPQDQLRTGEYLPTTENPLQRAYDAATPLEREQLAASDPRFKKIHEFYLAQDLINKVDRPDQFYKPMVPLDTFDTRLEARKNFLIGQGLAPDFAEATAKRQALAGAGKMTPYGEVREAPKEYDIEQEYRLRPEMTGIEETGQILKRAGVKGVAGLAKGYGGVNRFLGDALGLDTTDTQRTLDSLNRYTQAIGVAPSKPVSIFEGAVESITQQVPALIGGAVTGSEGLVLASMFTQAFGQTYDDSKRMGMDTSDAAMRASLYATFEVVGEKFGLGDKLKGIQAIAKDIPTKDLSTFFAKALVKEIPGEQLTYAGQFATDKGFGVNPEAGFKEFFEGAGDTLAATVAQGTLMLGGGAGAQQIAKKLGVAKPEEKRDFLQEVADAYAAQDEAAKKAKETRLEAEKQEIVPTPQTPEEIAPEAPTAPPTAVAPEATTVAPEATPIPPEIATEETGGRDMKKMLAELEGIQEEKVTETPQEIIKTGVAKPASPEGQVLENIERKQTATPQFKEWFGDSKVTDESGQPLVVYHGTTQDIKSFDPSKSFGNLNASFFTEDPKFASSYDYTQGKGNVLPVYLSAKNIFDFGNKEQRDALKEAASKIEIRDPVRGFVTLDTKIPDSEQYFDTEHPEVFQLIKELGYDGVKLKERGVTNYAVFNPTQIKSAIGNTGAFSKESPNITENIERVTPTRSEFTEESKRNPSFKVEMNRLSRLLDQDKITPEQYVERSQAALEASKKEREYVPRKRGYEIVMEKINKAVRKGELAPEARDLLQWFVDKNKALLDDVGISMKAPPEDGGSTSGFYTDLSRIITLIKGSSNSDTAVHEVLHHLERMLPADVQNNIRKLWLTRLTKASKAAEKGDDQNLKDYFKNLNDFFFKDGGDKAIKKAKALLTDGVIDYDNYQYMNPSEFWAVNATNIVAGRFEGSKGFLPRLKQWLKEFAEKIKSLFGVPSDSQIIKALDSLAKADGKFVSDTMLSQAGKYENLRRTFKDKKTGQQVSEEATPELYSFTMPEEQDRVLGFNKDDVIYQFLDKNIDNKRLQQAIEKTGNTIEDMFNPYQKQTLYHGRVASQVGDFLKDDVLSFVRDMNKENISLEEIEEYLHMRHAEERNDKMNEINEGNASLLDRGSGVSTDDARKYFKNLSPEKKAKLEGLAKKVDDIIAGTQDILVDSGVEEKGLIDTWRKTYKHYVPLFREDDDFVSPPGTQLGNGFRVTGKTSKRATGSTKKVSNIIGNIIAQRERAIIRAEKTKVARALYGLAVKYPNPNFWYAFNPDAVRSKKEARAELIAMGVKDVDAVMNLIDAPRTPYQDTVTGQVGYRISPLTLQQHNAFPVKVNGKDRYIFFNQKSPQAMRMAKTLGEIDTDKLDMITTNVGKATRYLAAINTQYNPIFGVVNLIRDVKGAMYNLSSTELAGHQSEVARKIMPSMNTIRQVLYAERNGLETPDTDDAKLFKQFRDDGGQTGYRDSLIRQKEEEQLVQQELNKISDPAIKKYGRHFVKALSDFNDTMENAVRFAAYKTALDNGMSRDKAAYIAKELTVNFDRKGNLSNRINAYFAFFNPAIQGSARIYQTLTGPAGKKIMAAGVGLGAMQAVMLIGYPDDDPPEFVRERNFILPIPGTGKLFTIPYPLGYNIFPNIGRLMTEVVLGQKKPGTAITDLLGATIEAVNPLGGSGIGYQTFTPTVLKIPVQLAENKDAFGRPIFRADRANAPTPGYKRARETAGEVSKFISKALNYMSFGTEHTKGKFSPTPEEIEYVFGQLTGGVGRETMKTAKMLSNLASGEETPSYGIPLVGRFYGDVGSNAAKTQRFFNNVVEMANHEQEITGRQKNRQSVSEYMKDHPEARLWQQANTVENQIAALKKERKALYERNAPESAIKQKNDQMIRLMDNFNKQVERLKK